MSGLKHIGGCTLVCLALTLMAAATPAASPGAQQWVGRTFRVTGVFKDEVLRAESIQLRAAVDERRGQVSGQVRNLQPSARRFRIGPFVVAWTQDTRFDRISAAELAAKPAVRISGKLKGDVFVASSIRPTEDEGAASVQLTAKVTSAIETEEGGFLLKMLDTDVSTFRSGFNGVESLVRRQDSRRPIALESSATASRPFAFASELSLQMRDRRNLSAQRDQRVDSATEFQVEGLYSPTERVHVLAGVQLVHEADLYRDGGGRDSTFGVERDQMWLFLDRIGGSGFGLQVGRQNFKEPREWWWDDDLDAIRLYFDQSAWHAELAAARELAPVSTATGRIDPEMKGVSRVLGTASWLWASRQKLEFYFLHANDASRRGAPGDLVDNDFEDESDARLTWLGARAIGTQDLGNAGSLKYWADWARVRGNDDRVDYEDEDAFSRVTEVERFKVRGSAFDIGATWETPLPASPSLTLGLARGSGGSGGDAETGFRQTGLHNNKWRYAGVNRFRAYGEVLRPELSNLRIETASLGVPLLSNSSVELSWHRYRQVTASDSMLNSRLDIDPTGESRDIGKELDLVLGFREGRNLDLALIAGLFKFGAAFEQRERDAYIFQFEATWNF